MNAKSIFLLSLTLFCTCFAAQAQVTDANTKTTTVKKFKPPKLYSYLGILKDSTGAPVDQAKAVIINPLRITDDKNIEYTVTSYQFGYKRSGVVESDDGRVTPTMSFSSQQFYNNKPLPDIWIKTIREQLKPGEELYFFDIMVKDSQGRYMFAPELKITTK